MELHQRLTSTRAAVPVEREPFADLKNLVHMEVIGELGPQLTSMQVDPAAVKDQVLAKIKSRLALETSVSREDRQRLTTEIADDILGYGPLERLLPDDSITEIMVNGPSE